MAQMKTDLGLVLKHVPRGVEKVNVVNYLNKPPPPVDDYYYEEDSYIVNEQTRGFRPNAEGSNKENWRQGQGNQGRNMGITIERAFMFEMETTTATTTSTEVPLVIETIEVGPMFCLKIGKLLLGMVDIVWHKLRICCRSC